MMLPGLIVARHYSSSTKDTCMAKVILQNFAGLVLFTVMVKYGYTTELIFVILAILAPN